MANASEVINATSQAVDVGTASAAFFTVVIPELFRRLFIFFAAPFLYLEMWWLLIHLFLTFVLFELYFDRHHNEELGWGAALANSIVMIFISAELLRQVYHHEGSPFYVLWQIVLDYFALGFFSEQMVIVSLVIILGIAGLATAIINYFHLLPKKVAYIVSGHKTVNLLAYFLIVIVFRFSAGDAMPLDWLTFIALIMFGGLLWGLLFWINHKRARKRTGRPGVFK